MERDPEMRTTLTLDDDLGDALRERARLLNIPFKQAVNDALRRGMSPGQPGPIAPEFRVNPFDIQFTPGVDPLKLNQLSDELAVDAFVESRQP